MIVVSDTSPICYLVLIDQISLLPQLYSRVVIPQSVHKELCVTGSPEAVGLLGILGTAANEGLVDFPEAIARLQATNFWASPKLLQRLLERYSRE